MTLQPHIRLDETVGARCALLPGDPARLDRIAPFLTNVRALAFNREYRSLVGEYRGLPVLALQPRVKLGDLILVSGAVRDDGASKTYFDPIFPAVPDTELLFACVNAAKALGAPYHAGIARSHDSFYTDHEAERDAYWHRAGVLGSDMETAALFTIGALRGVKTASILNNVVAFENKEDTASAIGDYVDGAACAMRGEENEIRVALEAFRTLLMTTL